MVQPSTRRLVTEDRHIALATRVASLERDTGWRRLPVNHANASRTGGLVELKRTRNQVRARFLDVSISDGAGPTVVIHASELPTGFSAPRTATVQAVGNSSGNAHVNYLRANASWWWVKSEATTVPSLSRSAISLAGEIYWLTDDPWPTTLPGTPA